MHPLLLPLQHATCDPMKWDGGNEFKMDLHKADTQPMES